MTSERDLAAAVRDAAKQRLENGEIRPTLRDGLAAQALLDRREEKQRDRNFMLSLARLTSGSSHEVPAHIIEGSAKTVTPAIDAGEGESEDS